MAGLTDALDGLIARRSGQKTNLGRLARSRWRTSCCCVTTFVVLTLPGLGLANRLPIWLTVLIISRDVVIVLTVAVVNLAIGPRTFRPSIFGKAATATYIVTAVVAMFFNYPRLSIARSSSSSSGPRWRSRSSRAFTTSGTRAHRECLATLRRAELA